MMMLASPSPQRPSSQGKPSLYRPAPPTVQVGFFIVLACVVLMGVFLWMKGRDLQGGQSYSVQMEDIDGLKKGAPVQLMGIRIGFVEAVAPAYSKEQQRYLVEVKFRITTPDVSLPPATQISVEQSGLISEKLLELTPPELNEAVVSLPAPLNEPVNRIPVRLKTQQGWLDVATLAEQTPLPKLAPNAFVKQRHVQPLKLTFRLKRAGVLLPEFPAYSFHDSALWVTSTDPTWHPPKVQAVASSPFTVVKPIRLKDFLEIQIASAESFKLMNDKMAALMDDETIADIQALLGNVKTLSKQVHTLVGTTNTLLKHVDGDIEALVHHTEQLTGSLTSLIQHTDSLLKDPTLNQDLRESLKNLKTGTERLNQLLADPALNRLISEAEQTTHQLNKLTTVATQKLENEQLTQKLDTTLTELNQTFTKVNGLLTEVEASEQSGNSDIKTLLRESQSTITNLRLFSERLKGRFVLFKLMF